jgi:uncharacterized repeat protein (TIGR03803 family)
MKKLLPYSKLALICFAITISISQPLRAQYNHLLGMTYNGGANNKGVIFSFDLLAGTEQVAWSFGSGQDGSYPFGSLVYWPSNSLFYGLTVDGGSSDSGAIISFDPTTNTENVVADLTGSPDANTPYGSLTAFPATGLLYGMSEYGGLNHAGTAFSYNPQSNAKQVLIDFGPALNEKNPVGSLVYDTATGLLYGMTQIGGTNNQGTLFNYNPTANSETLLWSFGAGTDGIEPNGDLVYDSASRLLYGMTPAGGGTGNGTIFSYATATSTYAVIYNFGSGTDGSQPEGDLAYDPANGLYYGMTYAGGVNSRGTIFSYDPSASSENVVWSFGAGTDGFSPYASLVYDRGTGLFYGMTSHGGAHGYGAVISFNPSANTESVLWSFAGGADGAKPFGSLSLYAGPTGINSVSAASAICIYPNPANGMVNISGATAGQQIEVYDYLGEKVKSATVNIALQQLDISAQQGGIYLVQILNKDGSIANEKKIVKTN